MQGNLKIPSILLIVLASAALISSGFAPFVPASRAKAVDDDALTKLRDLMKGTSTIEPLVAYIIPTDDAHQSEYIAPRDRRREFITGFTGSAGTAVVTQDDALLWTDGRYFLQAEMELKEDWTLMKSGLLETPTMTDWLKKHCKAGDKIGVDASLYSASAWNTLVAAFDSEGCVMTAVEENLVDLVWDDQPDQPNNEVITLDLKFSGKLVDQKLVEIRAAMKEENAKVLVVTNLDEVAYLFNLRGSDIEYNPVFFSYAMVTESDVTLFIEPTRINDKIRAHFTANNVQVNIKSYKQIFADLAQVANDADGKVWISYGSSQALTELVPRKKRLQSITPVEDMKALKNDVEAKGMIESHIRDGVALVKYFAWLENVVVNKGNVTELSGAAKLAEFRSQNENFMGLSFETISGSGPHGAIIHYAPTVETDREITDHEMYLCDSGGQYLDGTTDVTRTWHFGEPTDFEKEAFTRVFKGQWQVGSTVFPYKIKGGVFDAMARQFLWQVGLDYAHGTGHGIGSFLNVHEGPMGIGTRDYPSDPGFQVNMFMSNEPGFYQDGEFGIRLEDIVQVVKADVPRDFNQRGALTFHTITLCPIHTNLIQVELLTDAELLGLNAYHKRVFDTLSPLLGSDQFTRDWLEKETKAILRSSD